MPEKPETAAALALLSAEAVRQRAHRLLAIGLDDGLPNFRIHLDRMDAVAELVVETTRKAYPVVPPRVEYSLTALGHRFLNFAMEILDWTIEYRADFEAAREEFESQATRQ